MTRNCFEIQELASKTFLFNLEPVEGSSLRPRQILDSEEGLSRPPIVTNTREVRTERSLKLITLLQVH